MQQANRSIAPSFPPVASPQIDAHEPQGTLHTGPTGVVHRGAGPVAIPTAPRTTPQPRASNAPLAWLATADVTPSAKRLGTFLAKRARYATAAERDRKVAEGEIFCYWTQRKTAAELGCGVRHVKTAFRSLRDAGGWESRQRVRPYGASYGLCCNFGQRRLVA